MRQIVIPTTPPKTDNDILQRAIALLVERLPSAWAVTAVESDDEIDALFKITDRNGASATAIVEVKRSVKGRDVEPIAGQLNSYASRIPGSYPLLAATYLSAPVRERLTEAGVSYIDATGNVRLETEKPGLFVATSGSDNDPWRGAGRPRGTLRGAPAAKVVRVIADVDRSWTMRDLVKASLASTGSAYRVVEFLEEEGLAVRDADGRVEVSEWANMLRRWSQDYSFVQTNSVSRWIAPRGLPDLIKRISRSDAKYAVTGTIAAAEWAAYAPARLASIYVVDEAAAAKAWDLRPADAGANVILAMPKFDVVFDRAITNKDGLSLASPTQVVVDLMTGPGRNPGEAEELLEWMERNERTWRN